MIEKNNINKDSLVGDLKNESIELLEWPLLKKQLSSFASTPMGKKSIIDFEIPVRLEDTQYLLDQTMIVLHIYYIPTTIVVCYETKLGLYYI